MNVCYYCGDPADGIDHVVPQSLIRDLSDDPDALRAVTAHGRILEVDCCADCNSRLSIDSAIARLGWHRCPSCRQMHRAHLTDGPKT